MSLPGYAEAMSRLDLGPRVNPRPIVEDLKGGLEFLLPPATIGGAPRVASRDEPFPTAENLLAVLGARRVLQSDWEQYGTGRAANNLAAVYIVTNRLSEADKVIREAELRFIDMLNSRNPYPWTFTYRGIAMARYNMAVYQRTGLNSGEFGPRSTDPREISRAGLEILGHIEDKDRDKWDFPFLESALRDI